MTRGSWRPQPLAALALVSLLGVSSPGCRWAFRGDAPGAGKGPPPVTFSHQLHQDQGVECVVCHAGIAASSSVTGNHLPKRELCQQCHDDELVARNAPGLDELEPRRAGLFFSHQLHLEQAKRDCADCHAGTMRSTAPGQRPASTMDSCTSCHQREMAENRCTACHVADALAKTRPVRFLSHAGDWVRNHKDRLRGSEQACQQCHTPSDCSDCHDRYQAIKPSSKRVGNVTDQLIHRGDFVTRHALEARGNGGQCLTCHSASRCDSCHVQSGVGFASILGGPRGGARTPHPAGFMDRAAAAFHGRSARKDILSCASCHDQGPATNCISCHKAGSYGGNPHPPGFNSALDRQATPMCQWCHGGR
jgi:hypothetical protein